MTHVLRRVTYFGGGGILSKLPTGATPLFALGRCRGRYERSLIGEFWYKGEPPGEEELADKI